jgi:hypothetical protein
LEFYHRRLQERHDVLATVVKQRIVDTWDDAVAGEGMHFDSPDQQEALQQQAIGLVQTYLEQRDSAEEFPVAVESRLACSLPSPAGARESRSQFVMAAIVRTSHRGRVRRCNAAHNRPWSPGGGRGPKALFLALGRRFALCPAAMFPLAQPWFLSDPTGCQCLSRRANQPPRRPNVSDVQLSVEKLKLGVATRVSPGLLEKTRKTC